MKTAADGGVAREKEWLYGLDLITISFEDRGCKPHKLSPRHVAKHRASRHLGTHLPRIILVLFQSQGNLVDERVVWLIPRVEGRDHPRLRSEAVSHVLNEHERNHMLLRLIHDPANVQNPAGTVKQIETLRLHAFSSMVLTEFPKVLILRVLVPHLQKVLAFKQEVDVRQVLAPLSHLETFHDAHIIV